MPIVDFNPADESADDVAASCPVRLLQPIPDHLSEQFQLTDHELERARLLRCVLQRNGFRFELRYTLSHSCHPRFELLLTEDSLGVAVDQSAHPVPQLGKLSLDAIELWSVWPTSYGVQPALIFSGNAARVLEQLAELGPDRIVKLFYTDATVVASARTAVVAPFRRTTAIIVVAAAWCARVAGLPSAAIRVTAFLA